MNLDQVDVAITNGGKLQHDEAKALLAECKRQREQIQALKDALQLMLDAYAYKARPEHMDLHSAVKASFAALAVEAA